MINNLRLSSDAHPPFIDAQNAPSTPVCDSGVISDAVLISALSSVGLERRFLASFVGILARLNLAFLAPDSGAGIFNATTPMKFHLISTIASKNRCRITWLCEKTQ